MSAPDLILTPLGTHQAEDVHILWSDGDATLFTNFPHLPTVEGCRQRLGKMMTYYAQNAAHFGPYSIRSAEGKFLGLLGGDAKASEPGAYEIWYFIRRDHWGKKVATTAVGHLLSAMRESGRVRTIKAEAVVDNEPSWRFLERLGFTQSARLPNSHKKGDKAYDRFVYSMAVGTGTPHDVRG